MKRQSKYFWLIVVLLALLSPSIALAWSFSVSPVEVKIDNLPPGEEAEFNLTIDNKDNTSHTFILTTHNPEESERRQGRAEFPNSNWVSFPHQVEVQANSEAEVRVKVAIPSQQKWAGKNWEIWLSITPEEKELLVVNYYIRLLVSTSEEVKGGPNVGLIAGIAAGVLLLAGGMCYFRRKAKPRHPQR